MRERLQLRGLPQRIALTFLHLRVDIVVALVVRLLLRSWPPVEPLRAGELVEVIEVRPARAVIDCRPSVVLRSLLIGLLPGAAPPPLVLRVALVALLVVSLHLLGARR